MPVKKIICIALYIAYAAMLSASSTPLLMQIASVLIKVGDSVEVIDGMYKGRQGTVSALIGLQTRKHVKDAQGQSFCLIAVLEREGRCKIHDAQRKELLADMQASCCIEHKNGALYTYDKVVVVSSADFKGIFHSTRLRKILLSDERGTIS